MDPFDTSPPEEDGPQSALVRPYARTGGRTRPLHDFDLAALVVPTEHGSDPASAEHMSSEFAGVLEMCADTVSVAEIAARMETPLGVARVIIADMVDLGLVRVLGAGAASGDERDPAFLRRVLSGLQRL